MSIDRIWRNIMLMKMFLQAFFVKYSITIDFLSNPLIMTVMISRNQSRAARALLGWTQQDLAHAASLSKTAINNFERGLCEVKEDTFSAIRNAFENMNIEFIGHSGVNKREETIRIIHGENSILTVMHDALQTLSAGDELLVCNTSHAFEQKLLQDFSEELRDVYEQMDRKNIRQRSLAKEGDYLFLPAIESYRWNSRELFSFGRISITYGNKTAFKLWYDSSVILIESTTCAECERDRFEQLWKQATIPPSPMAKDQLHEEKKPGHK